MTAFSAKRRRAAEVRVSAEILASRMTSFAFVVRNGAIARSDPFGRRAKPTPLSTQRKMNLKEIKIMTKNTYNPYEIMMDRVR